MTKYTGSVHCRQEVCIADRKCALPTGSVHCRQEVCIADRKCALLTGSVHCRVIGCFTVMLPSIYVSHSTTYIRSLSVEE